jgi:hypothetical protein
MTRRLSPLLFAVVAAFGVVSATQFASAPAQAIDAPGPRPMLAAEGLPFVASTPVALAQRGSDALARHADAKAAVLALAAVAGASLLWLAVRERVADEIDDGRPGRATIRGPPLQLVS